MKQPLLLLKEMVKGKQLHTNMLVSLKTEPVTICRKIFIAFHSLIYIKRSLLYNDRKEQDMV